MNRLGGDVERAQGSDEVLRSLGVDAEEVVFVEALGYSCGVHHVVERVAVELSFEVGLRA